MAAPGRAEAATALSVKVVGLWLVCFFLFIATAQAVELCADKKSTCPSGSTCCPLASADATSSPAYGCCANQNSVCCAGGTHCCPANYSCVNGNLTCQAERPEDHPLATWTLQWNLCRGPFPLQHITAVPGLGFPYFSSFGDVQRPAPEDAKKLRAAVVVVHGAGRNADEYFCSMREAAQLQKQYPVDAVGVIAPWFMQSNDDVPAGTVFWDGSDPNGVWRAGLNSVPGGTANESVSSYTMLDRILTALNVTDTYPNLELVTLIGHSSGGQTVQRYTLTQYAKNLGGAAKRPHFRYIIANPSSFAYLDPRRWIDGSLVVPPPERIAGCPEYNDWEWGLAGGFPPYVQMALPQQYIASYAAKDVVYLTGLNDTCNEDLVPHCHSHGLEKTCMDLLEGDYRLMRARLYFTFLANLYERPVHRFVGVPNTSHDHDNMFQQPPGLAAIFSPPADTPSAPRSSLFQIGSTGLAMGIVFLVVCTSVLALLAYRWGRGQRAAGGSTLSDLRSVLTVRYHRLNNDDATAVAQSH